MLKVLNLRMLNISKLKLLLVLKCLSQLQTQILIQPKSVTRVEEGGLGRMESLNELLHLREIYFTVCNSEAENVCTSWEITP